MKRGVDRVHDPAPSSAGRRCAGRAARRPRPAAARDRGTRWPVRCASSCRRSIKLGEHVEALLDAAEDMRRRPAPPAPGRASRRSPRSGWPAARPPRRAACRVAAISSTRCDSRLSRSITSPPGRSSTSSSICWASEEMRASMRSNGSGSKCGALRRRGRSHDRARDLVEALLDQVERRVRAGRPAAREMVDRAGQRAHLVLQRAQRQRFRQVVDRLR